jgi:uncharacterized coiled-coil protein SlyX
MDIKKRSNNGNSLRGYKQSNYKPEKDNFTRNITLYIITFFICVIVGSICYVMAKENGLKDNNSIIERENNKIENLKNEIKDLQADRKAKQKNTPPPDDSIIAQLNSDIEKKQTDIDTLQKGLDAKLCIVEKIEYEPHRDGYIRKEKSPKFNNENCSSSVNLQYGFGISLLVIACFLLIGFICLMCMFFCIV